MSDYSFNVPNTGLSSLYEKTSGDEIDTDSLEINPVTKIQDPYSDSSSFNNFKSNPSQTSEITHMQSQIEHQVRFHLDEDAASKEDTGEKSREPSPAQSPTPSKTKFTAETKASGYSSSGKNLRVIGTSSKVSSASSRKESGILRVKNTSALEKGDEASDMSTENLKNLKIDDANEDEATPSSSLPDLGEDTLERIEENFKNFAKFGDPKSNGRLITLSNSDKWMKQAKIIDGKKVTTTDTGIYFKKLKAQKVSVTQYRTFLEDLAKAKKIEVQDIIKKLASCGVPGIHGVGNTKATDAVNRLTDASKYTGTHKQRFDDSGKGKGIAGRKDMVDTSGYVSGYQNKDTFEDRESK